MRIRFSLLILSLLVSVGVFAKEDSAELVALKKEVTAEVEKTIRESGKIAAQSYKELMTEKYLTGGRAWLTLAVRLSIAKCHIGIEENDLPGAAPHRICKSFDEYLIPVEKMEEIVFETAKSAFQESFQYSLKRSFKEQKLKDNKYIVGIGTREKEPHDKNESSLITDNVEMKKVYNRGDYRITRSGYFHFKFTSYIRTKMETLTQLYINSDEDRPVFGDIEYERLGPGINQTDILVSTGIANNRSVTPVENIITGDYLVTAKNLFCGCDYLLDDDKVVNTRNLGTGSTHRFELPNLGISHVTGTLYEKIENQERTPIPYSVVSLIPACDEADQCMREVKDALTDKDGHFTFFEVPKGGYKLVYNDEVIGEVKNCAPMVESVDAGDFEVDAPVCQWDVKAVGSFSGIGFGTPPYNYSGSMTWNNMVFEVDKKTDCSKHLPKMMQGYQLLNHEISRPVTTGDFPATDGLFINLMSGAGFPVTTFNYSMQMGKLGSMMNCGLWPMPGPCAAPDFISQLKKGKEFSVNISNDPMFGIEVDRFTYTFTPSKVNLPIPGELNLPDMDEDEDDDSYNDSGIFADEWGDN